MKTPFQAPTPEHLARLYYELGQIGARAAGKKEKWPYAIDQRETLLALAVDWTRWDPRLLEITVQYGLQHWFDIIPQRIRTLYEHMEMPQTFGVLSGFIQSAKPADHELHLFWNYVVQDLKPVANQYYFHDLYHPGSDLALREAKESLLQYRAWGFFSRERIIINSKTKEAAGNWGQTERLNILKRMFRKKEEISVSDYLKELDHTLSRQQALLDFKKLGALQKGKGRGGAWILQRKMS